MISVGKIGLINKLISRRTKVIPKNKQVYAVGTGVYVGEMLVYCKKDEHNYYFLSIPKMLNRTIPIDRFDFAIENKIAEFVTDLPKKIHNICVKQFEYNQKNTK